MRSINSRGEGLMSGDGGAKRSLRNCDSKMTVFSYLEPGVLGFILFHKLSYHFSLLCRGESVAEEAQASKKLSDVDHVFPSLFPS